MQTLENQHRALEKCRPQAQPSRESLFEQPRIDADFLQMHLNVIEDQGCFELAEHVHLNSRPDRPAALEQAHEATAYDEWFKAQVQASIDDPHPSISDEDAQRLFAAKRKKNLVIPTKNRPCLSSNHCFALHFNPMPGGKSHE
ncbi:MULTISPECIES: hypothetical protein [unclassified Pseudomonas]|uniref:antitoxin PaaA2 family protein n=1 Tax=unclassified Pseudomonas TaxID=196821 RepID=UPI000C2FE625|nr:MULTISPECIES: hypothetical protein [unclassified Pseudomonas]MCU1740292.1 hypothetical protein [Pseudomonas sp. 20S_6.2_Bac1]